MVKVLVAKSLGGGGSFIGIVHSYDNIISLENLLLAWKEFVSGKRKRKDVQIFQMDLMANIIALHCDLKTKTYRHGAYEAFSINDTKPRNIHKASVRDRLLHHALYRKLYSFFDRKFIADSYSCRFGKGTHRALKRFRTFGRKVSRNNTRTCWVLKCDVRKFFASIDQKILISVLAKHINDGDVLWLLQKIIESFYSTQKGKGLPLGNLTSQLLVNVYMNEFDQFVKHKLKAKYYVRYADDFVIISEDRKWLESMLSVIRDFLWQKIRLELHPDKVFIKTLASGVDFLGWIHFPDHLVLRTATKKRMLRSIKMKERNKETIQSYLGLLGHGNAYGLRGKIMGDNYL